jgi:hypothetical protein
MENDVGNGQDSYDAIFNEMFKLWFKKRYGYIWFRCVWKIIYPDGKFGEDIFIDPNGNQIDLKTSNFNSLANSESNIKFYNTALAHWIYGHVFNKIGSILLETSYSRAPYFVQQNMKSAYLNGTQIIH